MINSDISKSYNSIIFVDNSFPKTYKLTDAQIYKNLLGTRPALKTNYLNIHILPNSLTHARIGFIISKKMCKKANMRNQLKRIIREIFRHNKHKFGNIDILFRLKTNINFFKKLDYTNQKILIQTIMKI